MPLIEVKANVLLDTTTGMKIVHVPGTKVLVCSVDGEPFEFCPPDSDPDAVWTAIRAHVTPPPAARRIATGLEELCDRITRLERRVEMREQETADAEAVDALAGRLDAAERRGRRLDDLELSLHRLGDRVGAMREPAGKARAPSADEPGPCPFCGEAPEVVGGHGEPYRVRCRTFACPGAVCGNRGDRGSAIASWNRRAAPPVDPDAPRRFRWPKPDGSGEWDYGAYFPRTGMWSSEKVGGLRKLHLVFGFEWLDPEPEPPSEREREPATAAAG